MVLALHGFAVKPAGRERNAAVGAEVAHGKDASVVLASEEERKSKQESRLRLSAGQGGGTQRGIPVAEDEFGGWACGGRDGGERGHAVRS